jgi:branched-subunit amino acid transport protein
MGEPEVWLLMTLAAAATYASRLLGLLLAGRVAASGPLLDWIACVAYALLAGLVSRMLLLPIGPLAATEWTERVAGVAVALAVYFLTRRNVLLGVLAGTGLLALLA